ncbi:hypothetical protein [Mucilaginibacter sp.]|uniref:hypothetical protein n=1 Tax=Mucilaginibacter sp. TaxID=1882438 RepID=UPI0026330F50|nr:hypothetical protein [Mucilaginibacter sp.]MDB4921801.1 hypothetical protein [Mucilaginibacter sp.]
MAEYFFPSANPFLFLTPLNGGDKSWVGYLFSTTRTPPKDAFSIDNSWNKYDGSYIYSGQGPDLSTPQKTDDFVSNTRDYISKNYGNQFNGRIMMWLLDPNAAELTSKNITSFNFGISTGSTFTTFGDLNIQMTNDLTYSITSGCVIKLSENDFVFGSAGGSNISLVSQLYQIRGNISPNFANLPLTGNLRGSFGYQANFQTQRDQMGLCDFDHINFQFSYFYNKDNQLISQDYPIIKPSNKGISVVFKSNLDPTDILNKINPLRTWFAFTGQNSDGTNTQLGTWLQTDTAYQINLKPHPGIDPVTGQPLSTTAIMLFYNAQTDHPENGNFYLAPGGIHTLALDNTSITSRQNLLCGISGTEIINFQPWDNTKGDQIAFIPGQSAFSPAFPMKNVSLYDTGDGKEKLLLDGHCLTSWVSIYPIEQDAVQPKYSTQPKGSSLYNKDALINKTYAEFLGGFSSPVVIKNAQSVAFPLVAYTGIVKGNFDAVTFEAEILNPHRKSKIIPPPSGTAHLYQLSGSGETKKATTPQGLIATVNTSDGSWAELLIARNFQPAQQDIKFTYPNATLFQAFQVSQQFLVITENKNLGTLTSTLNPNDLAPGIAFYNQMNLEAWPFIINTGLKKQFGDYTNVLIFKFCEGTLEERVRNPQKWTQAKDFNASQETPDAAQLELTAVSQWIQDYIADAKSQLNVHKDTFFQNFVNIVTDPTWNGVLALKTDINLKTFPSELQGLIGGIDISRFNAHHFGTRVNPLSAATVDISSTSSMFGLINYFDRAYEAQLNQGGDPNTPVQAPTGVDYDFKVLKLQVLFENAAVKDFSSKAQLTMNRLFSDKVIGIRTNSGVNSNNTIVYNGSYQKQGDAKPIYIFDQVGDNQFLFDSNVLNYVEVIKSQFNTVVNQGKTNTGLVKSRFSFWGYLSFDIPTYIDGENTVNLDLFSFGNVTPNTTLIGLSISNLAIEMDFDVTTPTVRTFSFDTSHVAFDLKQSTSRKDSLYPNFALQLNGLISGNKDKKPMSLGYLEATTQLSNSLPDGDWYGLDCSLNLGTPGALASAVGFNSNLLLAWAPGSKATDSNYNLMVGMKLPGTGGDAKLLSLQGVLKVSIADINLLYAPKQQSFLLKLVDIGVKFLGIAKLPPGATISFYLFGNPSPDTSKDTLGWYAAYVKDDNASKIASEPAPKKRIAKPETEKTK